MRRTVQSFLAAALLVLSSVTAQALVYTITVPPAEPGNYDHIHTVGIISVIGGKLRLYKAKGFLNNNTQYRDISGWKLDDVVADTLHQYLSPRFSFVDIPVDRATIAATVDPGFFQNNSQPLRTFLQGLNRPDIDAYIFVRPYIFDGFPGSEHGLSLEIDTDNNASIWANYEIVVIDGKTFNRIARAYARIQPRAGAAVAFPGMVLHRSVPVDDTLALTDENVPVLKAMFTDLVRLTALETLRSLQFGVALPRPGGRTAVPIPVNKFPYPTIKSVAVVSALGDQITLGFRKTMFRHGASVAPIAGWDLDSQIETKLTALLDKRFTVKHMTVDRAQLAKDDLSGGMRMPVYGITPTNDVDAYIVVLKRKRAMDGLGDDATGVGMWRQESFDTTATNVFANYGIAIVDARTLMPIWIQPGAASPGSQSNDPVRKVPDETWTEKGALTPDQMKTVQDATSAIMDDSLQETAFRALLTGMMDSQLLGAPGSATAPPAAGNESPPSSQTPLSKPHKTP
jgi:hypothetical protein